MEGWVGLIGWLMADTLPTKWSYVNHRSGKGQGKSTNQRPTSQPLSHTTNQLTEKTFTVVVNLIADTTYHYQ